MTDQPPGAGQPLSYRQTPTLGFPPSDTHAGHTPANHGGTGGVLAHTMANTGSRASDRQSRTSSGLGDRSGALLRRSGQGCNRVHDGHSGFEFGDVCVTGRQGATTFRLVNAVDLCCAVDYLPDREPRPSPGQHRVQHRQVGHEVSSCEREDLETNRFRAFGSPPAGQLHRRGDQRRRVLVPAVGHQASNHRRQDNGDGLRTALTTIEIRRYR